MRKSFIGFYRPSELEFFSLWENCLFVFDANVLLNLYRYSVSTSSTLTSIIEQVSERIWLPHQVAYEYHKNRLSVISEQKGAYEKIQSELTGIQNKIVSELKLYKKHPFISVDNLLKRIERFFSKISKDLETKNSKHPDIIANDEIRDKITKLFDGKVGQPYSLTQLEDIYNKGKKRYENKIPPGFEDAKDKKDDTQYGDLLVWFQIIDKSKEINKPIILIIDDRKKDWWLKFQGRTIGPRPELIEEFVSETNTSFYMYQTDQFMEYAQKYLKRMDNKEAIAEVRDVRKRVNDLRNLSVHDLRRSTDPLLLPDNRLTPEDMNTLKSIELKLKESIKRENELKMDYEYQRARLATKEIDLIDANDAMAPIEKCNMIKMQYDMQKQCLESKLMELMEQKVIRAQFENEYNILRKKIEKINLGDIQD